MSIKNFMEDIVSNIVNEILLNEDKEIYNNLRHKQDIITYVLNRVPPKYYTSERGLLHGKLESQFTFQQRSDILFLTHEAIGIIKNRRASEIHSDYDRVVSKTKFLPHVIGEVLEETTFSFIPDVKVFLLFKENQTKMIDSSWKNPYITNAATKGYYHFWPDIVEDEMKENEAIPFKIIFQHPKFIDKSIDIVLSIKDNITFYKSHVIPIALLQTQEGVDISFLYE